MDYEGDIIRPPSEADAIILQVTVGCSHNRCTFCGAYAGVAFRLREDERIRRDIDFAARHCRQLRRLFFADGNVLCLPQQRLLDLCSLVRERLPWVRRLGLYANARDVLAKSPAELDELRTLGLDRVMHIDCDRMQLQSNHGSNFLPLDGRLQRDRPAMLTAIRQARAGEIALRPEWLRAL